MLQGPNILIVGASSFIGQRLYSFLKEKNDSITGTYFSKRIDQDYIHLDVTDDRVLKSFFKDSAYDVIVWLSANKNVGLCEKKVEKCLNLNSNSLQNVCTTLSSLTRKPKFIFLSSDYVFDGKEGSYRENATTSPKTVYGKSKLLAEKVVLDYSEGIILRTGAVMGKGGGFFDFLVEKLLSGEDVSLFENTYFTPTSIQFLLKGIEALIQTERIDQRILHLSGGEKMSRYELGMKLNKEHPKCGSSKIAPESLNLEDSLFHRDLSLVKSSFFESVEGSLMDDLLQEVSRYA